MANESIFTTTKNGNFSDIGVTTSFFGIFDDQSNQLRLSALDNGLSCSIWIPTVDPVTGRKSYPRDDRSRVTVMISQTKIINLLELINNKMVPAVEGGVEYYNVIVFLNKARTKAIEIEFKSGFYYLVLLTDIDPMNLIPGNSVYFRFEKDSAFINFDKETGEGEVSYIESHFKLFHRAIADYIGMGLALAGHSVSTALRHNIWNNREYLESIAKHMGIHVETTGTNTFRTSNNFDPGNNNVSTTTTPNNNNVPLTGNLVNSADSAMLEVNNLSDLLS